MKHELRLHASPFNSIVAGNKTIECRLFDEKRQTISLGDEITFLSREDGSTVDVKVVGLLRYATFKDLFIYTDLDKSGSQGYTTETASEAMLQFYTLEDQLKYGVLGIEFRITD